MSVSDPIADLLNRIRNAYGASRDEVEVPYSKLKDQIVDLLKREGYLRAVAVEGEGVKKHLRLELAYHGEHKPTIKGLRRVSKPGLRQYVSVEALPRVLGGMGMAILSTSSGIMTDREARRRKVGGEVLCHVW